MSGFKKRHKSKENRVKVREEAHPLESIKNPVFCFNKIHPNHSMVGCSKNEKAAIAETMERLSKLTWQEIEYSQRHGAGTEKIKRASIKVGIPQSISEDVNDFLAIRFAGKKPMIGYRNRFIFHIVYIDNKFSVYNHG